MTLYLLGAPVLLLASAAYGATAGFGHAEEQYRRADYRAAVSTLLSLPAKNAAGYALMGKAYYMDGEFRNAASCLEKAVTEDPGIPITTTGLGKHMDAAPKRRPF